MTADNNGAPVLAGVAGLEEALAPIIGAKPCSITRPMRAEPSYTGPWGRAWKIDLNAIRAKLPRSMLTQDATVFHSIIEAPWSSQVVHSYSLIAVHLRFMIGNQPVRRYLQDATHEMALFALHPMVERDLMLGSPFDFDNWLQPPVFAAQMAVATDEQVVARLQTTVELVCHGRLSPHPTHALAWAELFGDNMLKIARAPEQQSGET